MKSNSLSVAAVRRPLEAWRRRRKHREPIPEALWRAIVPLARAHGVSPVAQALRLNYTALKDHVQAGSRTASSPASAPAFVEVPLGPAPTGWPCVLELEDRRGTKLTLRLAQGGRPELLALAEAFWRQRS